MVDSGMVMGVLVIEVGDERPVAGARGGDDGGEKGRGGERGRG